MIRRLTPFSVLVSAALIGIIAFLSVLHLALDQPWMGMRLSAGPASDGGAARVQGLLIESVAPRGPAAALPVNTRLTALNGMELTPQDLLEEPDTLESYPALTAFFQRQSRLRAALTQEEARLIVAGAPFTIKPAPGRPLWSLPPVFWVQIVTGFATAFIGVWVWSFRQREFSAQLLMAAGICISISAFSAALYSTRELALNGVLFNRLSAINHFGTLGFGAAMSALFLIYPRRLAPGWVLWLLALGVGVVWLLDTARPPFAGPTLGLHFPAVLLMALILAAAIAQYRKARGDPAARAALRWFALSVSVGAGSFVAVILLPNLFGATPTISQGYAFLLFLVAFIGIAISVARYRLFELEDWTFSILFYFGAVALLLTVDALLIWVVAFERVPAFSLALLLVALLYLPSRDYLGRRLTNIRDIDRKELFDQVVEAALSRDAPEQERKWRHIINMLFQPLYLQAERRTLENKPELKTPEIIEDGLVLRIPGAGAAPPLRLSYAYQGRRLFSPRDARFAAEVWTMLVHTIERRDAQERGAQEERARITRDIHDNIGAQLLSALHSNASERKDLMIRASLADLRDIINNSAQDDRRLAELLADLRQETSERLSSAQVALHWRVHDAARLNERVAPANVAHACRSILREMVSNVIFHAHASRAVVEFRLQGDALRLIFEDNGKGLQGASPAVGNGLNNMRARLETLGGLLELETARPGLRLKACFPLRTATDDA